MVSNESNGAESDLLWWSPQMRAIIPLDGLKISRSMRRSSKKFEIRVDTQFENVMRNCAAPHRDNGWITEEFIDAYVKLHQLGWAHSIEVIDDSGLLAGGLYGVRINRFFAGESMFHLVRDASKVALMALVETMNTSQMSLLDVQWLTPHLASLGAIAIKRNEYLRRLEVAVTQ
jgi:leucyl/phenylalanyl-tRNA--protein transferase